MPGCVKGRYATAADATYRTKVGIAVDLQPKVSF